MRTTTYIPIEVYLEGGYLDGEYESDADYVDNHIEERNSGTTVTQNGSSQSSVGSC